MTQPSFVPIAEADQVRPAYRLHVPGTWTASRPAELRLPARDGAAGMGTPGPDQGYALLLARRFTDRLRLEEGEDLHDVLEGCALLAARRAGLFGRAPSVHDLTVAFTLWGFFEHAPADLVAERQEAFRSASHNYFVQRALVDRVPEESLRQAPAQVTAMAAAGVQRTGPPVT